MTGKLIAAGLIAALLAGSAVYFGASTTEEGRANMSSAGFDLGGVFSDMFPSRDKADDPASDGERVQNSVDPEDMTINSDEGFVPPDPDVAVNAESEGAVPVQSALVDPVAESPETSRTDTPPNTRRIERANRPQREGQRALITPIDVLIDQADKITIVAVKDDAYLNILDYALAQDRIAVASELIEKLSTPDLRDFARRSIAITHARKGRTDEAFAIVETVEVDGLEDPIRLEIIQTLAEIPAPR